MKKTLLALLFLFVGVSMYGQETKEEKQAKAKELMSIKIDMDIDKELFMEVTPNTYISENPKAIVMAMIVPETFENVKNKLESNMPPEFKVSEKGEKTMNGVNVLFMKGTAEAQGVTVNSTVYCLKRDADTCIMFMGMLEEGADQKYVNAINTAANSVVKK